MRERKVLNVMEIFRRCEDARDFLFFLFTVPQNDKMGGSIDFDDI